MRRHSAWLILLLLATMTLLIFAGCGDDRAETPDTDPDPDEVPAELQAVIDNTLSLAANYALQLDGEWADEYAACLSSGEGRNYAGYDDLKATLDQFRIESGACCIYVLTDTNPDDGYFEITVDGSEEPDDWMARYEAEGQFYKAYSGEPCAALSARNNEANGPVWSAFAPVYDSDGNVVGILGVDYPVPVVLDFPQWNRDSDEWNGMEFEY